jgi:hypothetical protein
MTYQPTVSDATVKIPPEKRKLESSMVDKFLHGQNRGHHKFTVASMVRMINLA